MVKALLVLDKTALSNHLREVGFKLSSCLLIGTPLPASYSLEPHLARPLYSWNLKARNLWNMIFKECLFNAFLLEYKLNFLHHSVHCFMFCDTTEVSEVSSKGEVLNYGKHTHMRAKWDPYHIRLPQLQLKHISWLFRGKLKMKDKILCSKRSANIAHYFYPDYPVYVIAFLSQKA